MEEIEVYEGIESGLGRVMECLLKEQMKGGGARPNGMKESMKNGGSGARAKSEEMEKWRRELDLYG